MYQRVNPYMSSSDVRAVCRVPTGHHHAASLHSTYAALNKLQQPVERGERVSPYANQSGAAHRPGGQRPAGRSTHSRNSIHIHPTNPRAQGSTVRKVRFANSMENGRQHLCMYLCATLCSQDADVWLKEHNVIHTLLKANLHQRQYADLVRACMLSSARHLLPSCHPCGDLPCKTLA